MKIHLGLLSFISAFRLLESTSINFKSSNDIQSIPLINYGDFFGIEVEVGTPPQTIQLLLHTGSDQTWIPSANDALCSKTVIDSNKKLIDKGKECIIYGVFDQKLSSTSNITKEKFSVQYFDESSVSGTLVHDDFRIGTSNNYNNILIQNAQFGYGMDVKGTNIGVMGLSLSSFHKVGNYPSFDHENLVFQMKKNGLISRNIFSIWLNKHQTETGSILFGAVDLEKYSGTLKSLKMINTNEKYDTHEPPSDYKVVISNIFMRTPDNYDTTNNEYDFFETIEGYSGTYISAIFDTSSYFTYFPEEIYNTILSFLIGYTIEKDGSVYIECLETKKVSDMFELILKFGTTVISVPFDFLIDKTTETSKIKGIYYCKLTIKPLIDIKNEEKIIFGQGILRSMYMVYDLDKFEISITPARFDSNFSNIVNITLQNDLISDPDGPIDDSLLPDVYDQKIDFIPNTRDNGFMKPLRNGACFKQSILGLVVTGFVMMTLPLI